MIEIREARETDFVSIYHLNCEEMGYEYEPERMRENLVRLLNRKEDKILVAVTEGKVVGYVHANDYDLLYAPHMKNIMGIAVFSQYQRCGIGKLLLSGIEDWARETGADGIRLVSGLERKKAHEFYRRCGYGGDKMQINFKKKL